MIYYSHPVIQKDLQEIASYDLPWEKLKGRTILVTGANGMLATYLIYLFVYLNHKHETGICIQALSRDRKKLKELFGDIAPPDELCLLEQDISSPLSENRKIDYILHFAGNASPYFIKTDPVGILRSNIQGSINILERARRDDSKILFASTREIYGEVKDKSLLAESDFGLLDPTEPRSCYPESKRAAEALMVAYARQYGLHINSVRLAHAYGPGMKLKNDGRVMADFMAAAVDRKAIILHSTGDAERAFCYLADAVTGLITILLKAPAGETYNLSNETEPLPIREVAMLLANIEDEQPLDVVFDIPKQQDEAYCKYPRTGLDTSKLEALGWSPHISLKEGLSRTLQSFR